MCIAVSHYPYTLTTWSVASMNIYHSTKTLPYVYYCEHKVTGEFYIGSRWANKQPSSIDFGTTYKTSSKVVKPRFDEFKWHIVAEFFNPDHALEFEHQLIWENWGDGLLLNKHCCHSGKLFKCNGHTQATKIRMAASHTGYKQTDEHKAKRADAIRGIHRSDEHKDKLREARKNQIFTAETRAKISASMTGRVRSQETKDKIRLSRVGKPSSLIGCEQPILKCPHCDKTGGQSLMKRWHFDKCKLLTSGV
jgi:hypothetical protein